MVTYIVGDLFKSPAKVLVNTVNTIGVMGKGIAKVFKTVYPEMFSSYQRLCEKNLLTVGTLWLYKTNHKWILNFPTKQRWQQPSRPEYIEAGLKKFRATYSQQGISSVAFPKLGCGNGELNWEQTVRPLMERYLGDLAIDVFIYLHSAPATHEHSEIDGMRRWLRTEPQALAFSTVWDDITEIVGPGLCLETAEHENYSIELANSGDLLLRLRDATLLERIAAPLQEFLHLPRPRVVDRYKVLIPQACILDLWQAIRGYGFCTSRMMPGGLDVLSPFLMPLLRRLDYMKPVRLSRRRKDSTELVEDGLQLYAPSSEQSADVHSRRVAR
jgi:O-acetyl-ADP-ribose deacetylase (regulator of RNase III)